MHARSALLALLVTTSLAVSFPGRALAGGGPFGLGLILGSPTGLSGKLYFNRQNALDFAVGAAFVEHDGLHIHVDYLWHPVMLASDEAFYLPLYFGVGGRILDHDHGRNDDDDFHLGARVPLGILFDFKRVPIDIFIEIALVVDFLSDHDGDRVDLNGGVGIRYYF